MTEQMNRDEQMKQLVFVLDDIFSFLQEAGPLKTIINMAEASESDLQILKNQMFILVHITQQTIECAHFICDYAKDTKYCM